MYNMYHLFRQSECQNTHFPDRRARNKFFSLDSYRPIFWGISFGILLLSLIPTRAVATPFAYAINRNDNTVSVINTETNDVIATVLVGRNPAGVAATPDGAMELKSMYHVSTLRLSSSLILPLIQ